MSKKPESERQVVALDNATITLLAVATAYATKLVEEGEVIGPLVNKVQTYIEQVQRLSHFKP